MNEKNSELFFLIFYLIPQSFNLLHKQSMNEKNFHLLFWYFIFSHFEPLKAKNDSKRRRFDAKKWRRLRWVYGLKTVSLGFKGLKNNFFFKKKKKSRE